MNPATEEAAEPWWFAIVLMVAVGGFASLSLAGLVLAILGAFELTWTLLLGIPLWIGLVIAAWPLVAQARAQRSTRAAKVATCAALVMAAGFVVWNAPHTAQHVLTDRDPGSYTSSARWLAAQGSLEVDLSDSPFTGEPGVIAGSAAVAEDRPQTLHFQFTHLPAVALAMAHEVGGDPLMFRASLVFSALGLLLFFALALRILRNAWLALVAMVGLSVCFPQIWFSRDTYSEIPMQLLLLGALWLLTLTPAARRAGPLVFAGVVFGAVSAARIDSLLLLSAGLTVLGVEWVGTPRGDRNGATRFGWFALGAVGPVAIGVIDLATRSPFYFEHLERNYTGVAVATALIAAAWIALGLLRNQVAPLLGRFDRSRAVIGTGAAAVVAGALAFLWGPRRLVSQPRRPGSNPTLRAAEMRAGFPPDGNKTYAERSVEWIVWYAGIVTVVLGVFGAALIVRDLIVRRRREALGLLIAFCTGGIFYLWRPSIFPDQPWAMRRMLPVVLPAFFIFATYAVGWIVTLFREHGQRFVASSCGAALAAGIVVLPALTTWPIRQGTAQQNFVLPVLWVCDQVGDDGAILVMQSHQVGLVHRMLPQALRAWCDVPVASEVGEETTEADIDRLARRVESDGRELYLLAGERGPLERVGREKIMGSPLVDDPTSLVFSLDGPPDHTTTRSWILALAKA